jgi:hypothetical protein
MINYVIYGHTDYLDVLNIQTDHIKNLKNKILFLNKNDLELGEIYSNYSRVIFYNDNKPYPQRLSECLKQIDDTHIVFIHDIDIIFNVDVDFINGLHYFLNQYDFDRIDLKHTGNINKSHMYGCKQLKSYGDWSIIDTISDDISIYLIKQDNPSDYIYNVNPSIWKTQSFLEIMESFPNKDYRTIEDNEVQNFSSKYSIFKIHSKEKKECGHFDCIKEFIFFHITHNGNFVPLANYSTVHGQSYWEFKDKYEKIVDDYNLKNSNKWKN